MRAPVLALALLLDAPLPLLAQPAPVPQAAPALSPALPVTAEGRAAARALMEAMGGTKQAAAAMDMIRTQLGTILAQSSGKPVAEVGTILDEVLLPEMRARLPELQDAMAELWAGQLTVEELNGLSAFYRTPLGARVVAVSPAIGSQVALLSMGWGQRVATEALGKQRDALRARGLKI
jgi:hypothetical protein